MNDFIHCRYTRRVYIKESFIRMFRKIFHCNNKSNGIWKLKIFKSRDFNHSLEKFVLKICDEWGRKRYNSSIRIILRVLGSIKISLSRERRGEGWVGGAGKDNPASVGSVSVSITRGRHSLHPFPGPRQVLCARAGHFENGARRILPSWTEYEISLPLVTI